MSKKEKKEIISYFEISESEIQSLDAELKELKLDLYRFLLGYKNFIEDNLDGLDSSIIKKIKTSIKIRTGHLTEKIKELKEDQDSDEAFTNNRWIVNAKIKEDYFGEMNEVILPSAFVYARYKRDELKKADIDADKLEMVEKMFSRDLDSDGDFDK